MAVRAFLGVCLHGQPKKSKQGSAFIEFTEISFFCEIRACQVSDQATRRPSGCLPGSGRYGCYPISPPGWAIFLPPEAAGGSFDDAVKLNYFCVEAVDPSLIPEGLKVRDRFVNTKTPPISTFMVVKRLVRPGWLIEVEAVAVVNL